MPEDPHTAPLEKAIHEGMRSSLVGIGANLVEAALAGLPELPGIQSTYRPPTRNA